MKLTFGGGGLDVGGAEVTFLPNGLDEVASEVPDPWTVGLTGTMGFSISVFGTGGQTRFSNFTVDFSPTFVDVVGDVVP